MKRINKVWTEKEIAYLIGNYPQKGKDWCIKKLGRTEASIRWEASKLKLRQDRKSLFFKDWQNRARKSKIGKKRPEHSILMKEYAKEGRLPMFFSKKSIEDKERLSKSAKKWIKEKGHPRGMLGKHQTEKSKIASSKSMLAIWKNPQSKMNSKEYRQLLSDRMSKGYWDGDRTARGYSRGKMGTYDINGKKMFFRSLWEVNYALYLDFLIRQKQILKWEYEVETFWFEKIKRGVRSYKPDFKVFTIDGNIEYHEVKGWMDSKSKTKLKRMAKYYPQIKMILIEVDAYKELKQKIGCLAGFYE